MLVQKVPAISDRWGNLARQPKSKLEAKEAKEKSPKKSFKDALRRAEVRLAIEASK